MTHYGQSITLTAKTLHFLALRHLHLATSKIHGWGPTTYLIKYPPRIFYEEILYATSHFVPVRMADGQQGTKRPSDAPNPRPNPRPKKRQKTTPEPSSPLHPIPTSPNARTAALQAIEFQPLQGLHFERSIAPLPNTAFEIFQLFCPLELVDQWVEYTNRRPFWVPKTRKDQAYHTIGPSQEYARWNA